MSELKTLKDLEKYYRGDGKTYKDEDELKAEAVKWVKDCRDFDEEDYKTRHLNNCKNCIRFMIFFNLTEEDLE